MEPCLTKRRADLSVLGVIPEGAGPVKVKFHPGTGHLGFYAARAVG
jgi:hypothetical protein